MEYDSNTIEKYAKKTDAHWQGLYPAVIKSVGEYKDKKILDIGCGTGELSRYFSENGALVDAIDTSSSAIKFAKQQDNKTNYALADAQTLPFLDSSFDIAIMNMVLMHFEEYSTLEKAFSEASRVLKKGGKLIFSDLHPICKMTPKMLNRTMEYCDGFSYFKDESKYIARVKIGDESISFHNTHWTLPTLTKVAQNNGLSIAQIVEPENNIESSSDIKFSYPEYILFVSKKVKE